MCSKFLKRQLYSNVFTKLLITEIIIAYVNTEVLRSKENFTLLLKINFKFVYVELIFGCVQIDIKFWNKKIVSVIRT